MGNQEKIYKQFQNAAEKAEIKPFSAQDKVWKNLESKLDKSTLKREKKTWKKVAIAASILLLATLSFDIFYNPITPKTEPQNNVVTVQKKIPITDSIVTEKAIVISKIQAQPLIKKNAPEILKNQIAESEVVVSREDKQIAKDSIEVKFVANSIANNDKNEDKNYGYFHNKNYEALSVIRNKKEKSDLVPTENEKLLIEKSDPLIVVDGKAVKGQASKYDVSKNFESVEYLSDPIYIINGVEYSEKELFGPNPTSPYYPLTKQNIVSTTILQGEIATNLYGEKGKKGIVIIATKDKKPLKK